MPRTRSIVGGTPGGTPRRSVDSRPAPFGAHHTGTGPDSWKDSPVDALQVGRLSGLHAAAGCSEPVVAPLSRRQTSFVVPASRNPTEELQRLRCTYFLDERTGEPRERGHRATLAARLRADPGAKLFMQEDCAATTQPTDYTQLLDWLDPASARRPSFSLAPLPPNNIPIGTRISGQGSGGSEPDVPSFHSSPAGPSDPESGLSNEWVQWSDFRSAFLRFSRHPEAEEKHPQHHRRQLVPRGDEGARGRFRALLRRVLAKYDARPERDHDLHPPDPRQTRSERTPLLAAPRRAWRSEWCGAIALVLGCMAMAGIGSALDPFLYVPAHAAPPPAPAVVPHRHAVNATLSQERGVTALLLAGWTAQGLHVLFLGLSTLSFLGHLVAGDAGDVRIASVNWFCSRRGFAVAVTTGMCSGIGSSCWTLSFSKSTTFTAYLFNAFPPAVIMGLRALTGQDPTVLEVVGLCLSFFGALLCLLSAVADDATPAPRAGALLAAVSSLTNTVCIIAGKHAAATVPTVVYLAGITLFSACVQLLLAVCLVAGVSFTTQADLGLFGWVSDRWWPHYRWVVGLFALGQWGILSALRSIQTLRVAAGMSVVPVLAVVWAKTTHTAPWPGPVALMGGVVIVAGTVLLVVGGKNQADGPLDPLDASTIVIEAPPESPIISDIGDELST
eukprot:TRINITY_DN11086_c0_g1_i1.p1 TRINITY_DN11086_c0_g1~~TRINITY_DN11086_c0_g1_i1.p1  ORF type:complete len:706 (+),score=162.37 TRINITY_DN11086_c0_g1_i1:103-2118(+)